MSDFTVDGLNQGEWWSLSCGASCEGGKARVLLVHTKFEGPTTHPKEVSRGLREEVRAGDREVESTFGRQVKLWEQKQTSWEVSAGRADSRSEG